MPTDIENLEILQGYLTGVLERANHHAEEVNAIALAIVGGIIWKTTDRIKVLSREGEMKNVLWLQVGERRLCFVYNHENRTIDVKESSTQGQVVAAFNNTTPLPEVKEFFEML